MVAESDQPSIPARRLAELLRALREQEHLTQKQLARVLGGAEPLSIATISLWEKPGSDRLPSAPRLAAYARLFCSTRSFESGRLRMLSPDELTEQERERERELYEELMALRERAQATKQEHERKGELYEELVALRERAQATNVPVITQGRRSAVWHFPDPMRVTIVCSDAQDPPRYADVSHLNYSRYARYADLDSLFEVFGHVRADDPGREIRILSSERLAQDYALNHLVLIGGAASDAARLFAQDIPLPVAEEMPATDPKTHLFRCTVREEAREFRTAWDSGGAMVQDVGLIARGPHPIVPGGTVTLLSGITSRGVHGATLCFIDTHVRETNEQYLENAFGNVAAFCILMNIPVQNDIALPPNLWREHTRLYEWSAETGARWGDRRDEN